MTPWTEITIATAGISCLWLWSVRAPNGLKRLRLRSHVAIALRRSRAAIVGYCVALASCVLLSLTQYEPMLRAFAIASVLAPLAHAWLDPERLGFLHHRRLRALALAGHLAIAAVLALAFSSAFAALTPLVMAALVFHRYHRTVMQRLAESLQQQDIMREQLYEHQVATKLRTTLTPLKSVRRGEEDDKLPKAG